MRGPLSPRGSDRSTVEPAGRRFPRRGHRRRRASGPAPPRRRAEHVRREGIRVRHAAASTASRPLPPLPIASSWAVRSSRRNARRNAAVCSADQRRRGSLPCGAGCFGHLPRAARACSTMRLASSWASAITCCASASARRNSSAATGCSAGVTRSVLQCAHPGITAISGPAKANSSSSSGNAAAAAAVRTTKEMSGGRSCHV